MMMMKKTVADFDMRKKIDCWFIAEEEEVREGRG